MKKILLTLAIAMISYCSFAQYLPLTAGSGNPLTGDLYIDGTNGNRIVFSYGGVSNNKVLLGSAYSIFGAGSKDDFATYIRDSNPYSIWTNNIQRFTVDGNGNVGIGTVTPSRKLSVVVSTNLVPFATQAGAGGEWLFGSNAGTGSDDDTFSFYSSTFGLSHGYAPILQMNSATGNILLAPNSGNVGIGTNSPGSPLHISGSSALNKGELRITNIDAGGNTWRIGDAIGASAGKFTIYNVDNALLPLTIEGSTGNVGIGTTDPKGYKLAVAGNAIAESMTVDLQANWPDYTFKKDYRLMPLTDLKVYIDKNQHLPEVPTAEQVAKTGINLGEMNALLVKKVEELTLYLIEKDKEISDLKEKVNKQSEISSNEQQQINDLKEKLSTVLIKLKTNKP